MKNKLEKWFDEYVDNYSNALKAITRETLSPIIAKFADTSKNDKRIFVFGNGGSASNSSHFVTDFAKGVGDATGIKTRVISLNENVSLMTAISNDYSYDEVFSRQLANLAEPGDLVFTMSVSGNSPNLIKAVEWANKHDLHTIALVGGKKGKLYDLAKQAVVIDSLHYGHVEDLHMFICHIITYSFMENPHLLARSNGQ